LILAFIWFGLKGYTLALWGSGFGYHQGEIKNREIGEATCIQHSAGFGYMGAREAIPLCMEKSDWAIG